MSAARSDAERSWSAATEPSSEEFAEQPTAVLTAKAEQTNSGWRISALKNDVVWRRGTGLRKILNDPLYRQETQK